MPDTYGYVRTSRPRVSELAATNPRRWKESPSSGHHHDESTVKGVDVQGKVRLSGQHKSHSFTSMKPDGGVVVADRVGELFVVASLLLVVPVRGHQHREHRQGPMASSARDVARPYQRRSSATRSGGPLYQPLFHAPADSGAGGPAHPDEHHAQILTQRSMGLQFPSIVIDFCCLTEYELGMGASRERE